jgi:hypothetical protein
MAFFAIYFGLTILVRPAHFFGIAVIGVALIGMGVAMFADLIRRGCASNYRPEAAVFPRRSSLP